MGLTTQHKGFFKLKLILTLAKRDIAARYKGSYLGLAWSFINPLFMLAIYTFVFGTIFNARWTGDSTSNADFALALFAGLIVFSVFSDCTNRAPVLMLHNANYVKKVVFPIEILTIVVLCSALFQALVSTIIWMIASLIITGTLHWTIVYFPFVLIPLILFVLGVTWIFASLGVYLRDLSQFVGLLTTAMLFLCPIFYSASMLPEKYRFLFLLNPLTPIVEQFRTILYFGMAPDWYQIGISSVIGLVFAVAGYGWFQKTRKGFADVL